MVMSIARAVVLLGLVAMLGWLGGPVWACAGVGAGYAVHSVLTVILTARYTPLSARPYFVSVLRPLLACVPMFAAVAALRIFLAERDIPAALSLIAQVVCGGGVYAGAAVVLAGANVRELVRMIRPAPMSGPSRRTRDHAWDVSAGRPTRTRWRHPRGRRERGRELIAQSARNAVYPARARSRRRTRRHTTGGITWPSANGTQVTWACAKTMQSRSASPALNAMSASASPWLTSTGRPRTRPRASSVCHSSNAMREADSSTRAETASSPAQQQVAGEHPAL